MVLALYSDHAVRLFDEIRQIQQVHNFDPRQEPKQAGNDRALRDKVSRLRYNIKVLLKKFSYFDVPYDPDDIEEDLLKSGRTIRMYPPVKQVYLSSEWQGNDPYGRIRWKLGTSNNPHKRQGQLKTGNSRSLLPLYHVPGGYELETALKHYLSKRHIEREWYSLTAEEAKALFMGLEAEGPSFLKKGLKRFKSLSLPV